MNTKNTRKGFTTVELVIVIAVIAILATVLIPTFSNMIESANLSVDKQNVRNMNICLATYSITDGNPSDFGKVKEELKHYGYGKDDNFVTKTKGYSICWYTDDKNDDDKSNDISVIILVNPDGVVVFPEEYVDVIDAVSAKDPYKSFDLSLPAAVVVQETDETKMAITPAVGKNEGGPNVNLAALYTFMPARPEPSTNYGTWNADFFIRFSNADGTEMTDADYDKLLGISFAGYYPEWSWGTVGDTKLDDGKELWLYMAMNQVIGLPDDSGNTTILGLFKAQKEVPLVSTLMSGAVLNYDFLMGHIEAEGIPAIFKCGVTDTPTDDAEGIVLTVELRLSNPENPDDFKIIGIYEYEFK
ncbi:MAG: prepilin-type N-terminal cleavage/methylation domain-containing protein [Ruminococcaceae bacterium]|nr:prepilin-type N-terminal cleavage/methylation domain-containing protein [Oscillospiraceae bacterium]